MSSDPSSSSSSSSDSSGFECNICLEQASEPVVTLCGHLFCWSCLFRWMNGAPETLCPVCKARVDKDSVVPLYSRGKTAKDDPRRRRRNAEEQQQQEVPSRPRAQRQEPTPRTQRLFRDNAGFPQQAFGFQAGVGVFPFGFAWYSGSGGPEQQRRELTEQERQQVLFSKAMLILGTLVIFYLLFA